MDAEQMDFADGEFDFVWSWGVIHHSAHTGRIIEQVAKTYRYEHTKQCFLFDQAGALLGCLVGCPVGCNDLRSHAGYSRVSSSYATASDGMRGKSESDDGASATGESVPPVAATSFG